MKIKYGIFALMLLLVILFSGASSYQSYLRQRTMLINGIDKQLYTAAMMARATLPRDYHDSIVDAASVAKKRFNEIVNRYNELCVELEMEYLWSLMKINGEIVFTSSTSPDKITNNENHAKFFESHTNPELYETAFLTQKPQYQQHMDKWGKIQVVLIPFVDSHGRPYLFGAGMKLSRVDGLLRRSLKESIIFGAGFLLAGLILSYILARMLSVPLNILAFETSKIASGQFDKKVKEKGFYEYVVLAQSFNQMALAINEKIIAQTKSEEKYRLLFEKMMDGFALHKIILNQNNQPVDYRFVEVNKAFEKQTGLNRNDIIGKTVTQVLPGTQADTADWIGKYGKVALTGEEISFELFSEVLSKWYQVVAYSPKKGYFATIFMDITGLKRAENRLQKSEKKYQAIMESMKEPIYKGSKDLIIEYMNPTMITRTGRDATGEYCFKAIHGFDEKCPWCNHENVINGNTNEFDVVSPKDNCSYHISSTPLVNNDGSISSLNVFRDVTQLQKMETMLKQSQKMEAIGTLAGGIAHDFNNILFPILGHATMLLEDAPEDSPFRNGLNGIYSSALRAGELVKQILTFSRQEMNQLHPMKIQPIVKEALKFIRSSIPATINIKHDIRPECGVIKADPTQIHQIVMNLTTNAFHAMEKKGGDLTVVLKEVESDEHNIIAPDITPGVYACLMVADTGEGMDKELICKIFDPFFTTKEQGKGTGMGLSAVHGIVKSMGGAIHVYSEPGIGSEFKLYFPLEDSCFEQHTTQTHEAMPTGVEQILLVDDEKEIVKMEKQMLERLGYKVTPFSDSREALNAFRDDPDKFDMVITDMAMPNLPGDKLAVELIRIRPDIPVLLCTGFSETMFAEKAMALGIKGFLLKPIVRKKLAKKIREVLNDNKHQQMPN
ncbi:hybrid sensor histidine kinase/response regulator [Desulfobacula toluolica]|uniref:histidine kinase n=1 Tax=Desulfobacula toluolica (strain DSM 7467 / Tol2) TaxID=651182 RepID=K0NN33_DESTT|nr:ATP-binding protein [Desulfobacula toluolica]CCK81418.1 two component system sensor histidine kinase, hybrid [Desulfobacula toluolica Tol2]